jgi:hypothetical protein
MKNRRFYFALMTLATVTMLVYPRLLPAGAPAILRTENTIDFVYGLCIGIEIMAAWFVIRERNRLCPR